MRHRIQRTLAGLLAILLLTYPAFAATFPDVDEYSEYASAVEYISELGLMIGDDQGNFNPDETVTRAEMATILCRLLGETENLSTDGTTFTDVPISYWANRYVIRAAALGIVSGYGNGFFGPSDGITYEQAVTMIVRAANGMEEAVSAGGYPDGFLSVAQSKGFLSGLNIQKGTPMSRAYVAMMLLNYFNNNY